MILIFHKKKDKLFQKFYNPEYFDQIIFRSDFTFVIYWRISKRKFFKEMLQNLKSWNRKNIFQIFRDKMLKLWKHIFQVVGFPGQAYTLDGTSPNLTLPFRPRRLHELRLLFIFKMFLKMSQRIWLNWPNFENFLNTLLGLLVRQWIPWDDQLESDGSYFC